MKKCYPITKYILFIVSVLFPFIMFAHNGSIKGFVYDIETQQPLPGAVVLLQSPSLSTTTNEFGMYVFTDLPKGMYSVEIIYLSYQSALIKTEVNDAETDEVKTFLQPASIQLESVTIKSQQLTDQNTVSAIDIKLRPVGTTQDMLRLVPGLFIAQHAGGGKAEQIFLRGFDIDHGTDISVNVDGIPVNMVSHAHGQGYADLHFVIPETVNSFDFEKGPYNARYGDFATAGFVNFNTSDAIDKSMVKLSIGQFNTARTLLMLDLLGNQTNQSAYIAGEYFISDGPFESSQDFVRMNIFGKYHAFIGKDKIIEFTLSNFKSQWNASGQIPTRAVEEGLIDRFGSIDDNEGGYTGRTNANFEFTKLINNKSSIKNQVYYARYNFELYSNFTFFLEDSVNGDMIKQKEKRNLYGYKTTYSADGRIGSVPVTTEAGLGLRYDQIIEDELSHVADRIILLDRLSFGNVYQTNANAYISESFQLSEKFSATASLRFDYFKFAYDNLLDSAYQYEQVTDHIPTFKLNLNYQLNKNTLIYLHNGKGFHSNDTRVVVAQNGLQTLPAAYGSDLGMKFKPYKNLILNPALWVLYLEQEFVYVGDAAVVEPSGKTLRRGFDLSARWQLKSWLFLDADLNYTIATSIGQPEGENFIPLAPDLTSIGGISIKTKSGFNGSFRYRYMDDRPANEDGSVIAKGYFVNDLILNYEKEKYAFGIEIQNLFNVDWNEAQFDTESRLYNEVEPVSELHFTPGTPFFAKLSMSYFF